MDPENPAIPKQYKITSFPSIQSTTPNTNLTQEIEVSRSWEPESKLKI